MKIIVLDYADGVVRFGDIERDDTEYCEEWLMENGFSLDDVNWMVVKSLLIDEI